MTRYIYAVHNTLIGGYLSDNVQYFSTRHETNEAMKYEKEVWLDTGAQVTGSYADGVYTISHPGEHPHYAIILTRYTIPEAQAMLRDVLESWGLDTDNIPDSADAIADLLQEDRHAYKE